MRQAKESFLGTTVSTKNWEIRDNSHQQSLGLVADILETKKAYFKLLP